IRTVVRYDFTLEPSSSISISPTLAHRISRTVFAASETAFCAAFAKLTGETPTTSITFCTMGCLVPGITNPPLGRFGSSGDRLPLDATRFDFGRVREALQDRRELGRFLVHRLHVLLQGSTPFPDRGIPVGGVQPRGRLPGIEPPVMKGGAQLASPLRGVVELPEALDETHDGRGPAFQHGHVLAPLDLKGTPLIVPDRFEPGPPGIERAADEPRISEHMGELRIRVTGQLEQAVEGAAPERFSLRAGVVQETEERLRVRAGRRGRHADPGSLGCLEEQRDRLVGSTPGQKVEVGCGRRGVEGVHVLIEFLSVLRRRGRFRDLLEAIDLRSELPNPRLDRAVSLPIRGLETADLGPLFRDPIELPPRLPRAVEVPFPCLPKGCVEARHEPQGQALFLRGLAKIRGDRVDVPREDPHLAPVVDLALADQTVDPLPKPVEGPVHEPRDPVDPFARLRDRIEETWGLRLEGVRVRPSGGGHEGLSSPPDYLVCFGRRREFAHRTLSRYTGFRSQRPAKP